MGYPKHCIGCCKEKECKQKFFMLADTDPIDGYADFDLADYVCENCIDMSHNHCELDMDTEHDSPAHCSICGRPLNCKLSSDGVDYVKKAIETGTGCCRELWPVLFVDYVVV